MNIYEVKTADGNGWLTTAVTVSDAAIKAADDWRALSSEIVSVIKIGVTR